MHSKFLHRFLATCITLLFIIASVNVVIDPGNIYLKKSLADAQAKELSNKIISSPHGIIKTGWNERLTKTTLARSSGEFDCVILGSSHVMQISGFSNTGNINQQCKSTLNLGVSGGSLEDDLIFSNIILNNFSLPRKVFIAIDPWTLKFNMDSRYGAYKRELDNINLMLSNSNHYESQSYIRKVILNLFNGEYFYHSILSLTDQNDTTSSNFSLTQEVVYPEHRFSIDKGYSEPVTLPDGSHAYSSNWISKQMEETKNLQVGGGNYKISGAIYEQSAVELLEKLLNLYKSKGIIVSFIFTPYHPNVFKAGETKPVEHIKGVEQVIRNLAKTSELSVYGSFFPAYIGCKENEFYDFMHANSQCLNKIDFSK